jgi:hypothetical protein
LINRDRKEAAKPRDDRGRPLSMREQLMAKIKARQKQGR